MSSDLIQDFKKIIQQIYGARLAKVILYGSYARGDFHAESDIDFLVVLKDSYIKPFQELRKMNEYLYDLQLKYEMIISHQPTTLQHYEQTDTLFYRTIRKEGIEIYSRHWRIF